MTPATSTPPADQRARILAIALDLLSDRGVAATSMRDLASACGLNVSTLYHYFPSKADLVRSVIAERRYVERIGEEQPPIDPDQPPHQRLAALVRFLWDGALTEEPVWRLLISESIHGHPEVRAAIAEVVTALDTGIAAWLARLVPEVVDRPGVELDTVARLIHAQLFSLMIEHLALGQVDAERFTADLVNVVFDQP